jgi:hypothetical protein
MDIQVMLKEAITQVKDLETCGKVGALAEYLQFIYNQNMNNVENDLRTILFYYICAKYEIDGSFEENWIKVSDAITDLRTYIESNESLYNFVDNTFEDTKKEVIQDIELLKDFKVPKDVFEGINTIENLI